MSRVTGAGAVWTYAFFVVFVCLILVCLVVVLVAAGLTDAVVAFWVVVVATAKAAVLPRALRLAAMAPAKRALLQEMSAVMRAPELVTTIMINTTLAIQQGIASVSPGTPGPSRQELRAMMEAQRPQMLQAFGVLMLATFASTYTSISVDQLRQYVTFLKSP